MAQMSDDADFFITDITDGTDYFKTVTSLFDLGFPLFFLKCPDQG
jgi:hypothetical protein